MIRLDSTINFRKARRSKSFHRLRMTAYLLFLSCGPFFQIFLCGATAHAQALSIAPVNVVLKPEQKLTSLILKNDGEAETSVQIRAFVWSQNGPEDPLAPTNALVLSPPITTIAAGATQVVRIALREPPHAQEATYRILVDQIPPAAQPGVVHVLLRLSIPVFVETESHTASNLQLSVEHGKDGRFFLVASNLGPRHESIRGVALTTSDGMTFKVSSGEMPYVLPGNSRKWTLKSDIPSKTLPSSMKLTATTDSGQIQRQIQVNEAP